MNAYTQTNGAPTGRAPVSRGQREKVTFTANVPVVVTLEREPPSFSVQGNWGEQFLYSLTDNRIAFLEPEVHEQLLAAGADAGSTFTITKCKDGRRNAWSVIPGDVAAQAARAIGAPAPAPRPAQRERASSPNIEARIEAAEQENAARREKPQPVSGNIMAAALCSAIDAAQAGAAHAEATGANFRASSEDVIKLAISIYIEVNSGNHKGRR